MDVIGVGIVGCGWVAEVHAACLDLIPQAKVVATYDTVEESAKRLALPRKAKVCRSLDELLAMSEVRCVYVCTRHDSHPAIVKRSIEAGKDVYCEKPLALTLEEAEEVYAAVRKAKTFFMIGLQLRKAPIVLRIKEKMASFRQSPLIMRLSMVTSPLFHRWGGTAKEGGGVLPSFGTHLFDLARYLSGREVAMVSCLATRLRVAEPHLEDTATAILTLTDGSLCTTVMHDLAPEPYSYSPGNHMMIIEAWSGETAIYSDGLDRVCIYSEGKEERISIEPHDRLYHWGYMTQNGDFIRCLLRGERPTPNEEEALMAVRLVEAAKAATVQGMPVRI